MPWVLGFALSDPFLQEIRQAQDIPPGDTLSPLHWTMMQARALLPTRTREWTQCEGEDGMDVSVIYFYRTSEAEPPQLDGTDDCPTNEEMEPLRTRLGFREMWYWKTNNAFHDRPPKPVVYVEALRHKTPPDETVQERMRRMRIEEACEDGHTSNSKADPS